MTCNCNDSKLQFLSSLPEPGFLTLAEKWPIKSLQPYCLILNNAFRRLEGFNKVESEIRFFSITVHVKRLEKFLKPVHPWVITKIKPVQRL
jgi:hypothetical protein